MFGSIRHVGTWAVKSVHRVLENDRQNTRQRPNKYQHSVGKYANTQYSVTLQCKAQYCYRDITAWSYDALYSEVFNELRTSGIVCSTCNQCWFQSEIMNKIPIMQLLDSATRSPDCAIVRMSRPLGCLLLLLFLPSGNLPNLTEVLPNGHVTIQPSNHLNRSVVASLCLSLISDPSLKS